MRNALLIVPCLLVCVSADARADSIIVGYQDPGVFNFPNIANPVGAYSPLGVIGSQNDRDAVQFTLSGSFDVSEIDVSLISFSFNGPFNWSLQSGLTGSPTIFASGTALATLTMTVSLPVNRILGPGTYFLLGGTTMSLSDVGWTLSDGVLTSNGGIGPNGYWHTVDSSNWFFNSSASTCTAISPCSSNTVTSLMYEVHGTAVPESGTAVLLIVGLAALVVSRRA